MILVIFSTIYLVMPSQQYDLDVLGELSRINRLDFSIPDPAHPLYVWLGIPFYSLWRLLGYRGDALRAMQVINALTGAGSVALIFIVMRRSNVHRQVALGISACVGFSYAFWTHCADAFFIIPAAFFALSSLNCAMSLTCEKIRPYNLGLLAISLSLTSLCYQTNLLIIPSLMVASWHGKRCWRSWLLQWFAILTAAGVFIVGTWYLQATRFSDVATLPQFFSWLFSHGGIRRGLWRRENVPLLSTTVLAWGATIFPIYEGMRLRALLKGDISVRYLLGYLAIILFVIYFGTVTIQSVLHRKERDTSKNGLLTTALGIWFILPGFAVMWFDRAEIKLWIIPMFAIWILIAITTDRLIRKQGKQRIRQVISALIVLLPIALGGTNLVYVILPNWLQQSDSIRRAKIAISRMHPEDLLLSASFDWTGHVSYFCPECKVLNVLGVAQHCKKKEDIREIVFSQMRTTWSSGGRVFAVNYFGEPDSPIWENWVTPYSGLLPEHFASLTRRIAWTIDDEVIWEFLKAE